MAGFQCPYCGMVMPDTDSTKKERYVSFESQTGTLRDGYAEYNNDSSIKMTFYKCPNCDEYTIKSNGVGKKIVDVDVLIKPSSKAKQYPVYIPEAIRKDYEEAYTIVDLSPKASATLARRCLQGMIHDFHNIHEKNLNAEITALKDKVTTLEWNAIDALRKLGNIGAHMEHDTNIIIDIDKNEATKLIKFIEYLMDKWYIAKHETELLLSEIAATSDTKQEERKQSST